MTDRASLRFRFMERGIALVMFAAALAAHAQTLTLQNPIPSPTQLNDIHAIGSVLYAVGNNNTLVKSVDYGNTWTQQYSDQNSINDFRASYFQGANRGWAVGQTIDGGSVDWTNDGGQRWGRQIIQLSNRLNTVFFYSQTQGWTAGSGHNFASATSIPFIYFTSDAGLTWTRQINGVPTTANDQIFSVAFANNATGWAVGGDQNGSNNFLLETMNSGSQWAQTTTFGTATSVTSIAAVSTQNAFLSGDINGTAAILRTTNGGTSWNTQTFGSITGHVNNIVFPTASIGYAAGMKSLNGQNRLFVLKTTNGGGSWAALTMDIVLTDYNAAIGTVSAADANHVYVCGSNNGGWVAGTNDGGVNWTIKSSNAAAQNGHNPILLSASFSDVSNGWAVGWARNNATGNENPVLLNSADGGATWTAQAGATHTYTDGNLTGVSAVSASTIWAVGEDFATETSILLHSTDGGATWTNPALPNGFAPQDIAFSSAANGIMTGSGSAPAYYTNDSGNSWQASTIDDYSSEMTRIGSFYGSDAWALAYDQTHLLNTTDGGATWAVTFTSSFGGANYYVNGVSFIPSGQYGWACGWKWTGNENEPFMEYSQDGGNSWAEMDNFLIPDPYNPGNFIPVADQFNSIADVLAFSQSSAVAITQEHAGPNPASNRMLVTINGGNTWYNVDSSYDETAISRIAGKLTSRIDGWAVGTTGMIRHGSVNVPLFASAPDTLFQKTILSWNPTDSAVQAIAVHNPGSATLYLYYPSISGTYANDYQVLSYPGRLAPGATDSIFVQFKPDRYTQLPATLTITSNAVDYPMATVQLLGTGGRVNVVSYPSSLFTRDTVAINGGAKIDTVWVCSPGIRGVNAQLEVGTPYFNDPSGSYSVVKAITQPILPDNCDFMLVQFKPTSGGPKRGTMTFTTNTQAQPTITVSLGGVGGVRTIRTDVSEQNFADTVQCTTDLGMQCFTVSNPGTLPLTIDSMVFVNNARPGDTDFSTADTLPAVILPGGQKTFCVTYAPTVEGNDSSMLIIYSDALNAPTDTIMENGVGLQALLTLDTHVYRDTLLKGPSPKLYTVVLHNVGNIPISINVNTVTDPYRLGIPFPEGFMGDDSIHVQYNNRLYATTDTLVLILTWGNTPSASSSEFFGCGPTTNDTIMFIDSVYDTTSAVREPGATATTYNLLQNYPNPFNPATTIEYSIPQRSAVSLTVYNALGQAVARLVNETETPGRYNAVFDASTLPEGNYFYELRAGSFIKRMMMTVAK